MRGSGNLGFRGFRFAGLGFRTEASGVWPTLGFGVARDFILDLDFILFVLVVFGCFWLFWVHCSRLGVKGVVRESCKWSFLGTGSTYASPKEYT